MTFSHLCASCGTDLSRIAAPPDPHYGLAVVVCPRCRAACVRSRGEWVVWVRHILRLDAWITALGLQMAMLIACTVISAIAINLTLTELHDLHHAGLRTNEPFTTGAALVRALISPLIATSLVSGTWISLTLSHWRSGALSAWLALLAIITFSVAMSMHLLGEGDSWDAARRWLVEFNRMEQAAIVLTAAVIWTLPGMLAGSFLRRGSAPLRRGRFAWRRRRARRHRRGR